MPYRLFHELVARVEQHGGKLCALCPHVSVFGSCATSVSSPTATVKTIYSISGRARPNRLIRGRTFSPDGRSYTASQAYAYIFTCCDDGLGTNDFLTGEPHLLGHSSEIRGLRST